MAYNAFLHFSTAEVTFYLMFGQDVYMPTLFKLLMLIIWYMGDENLYTFGCHEGNLYDDCTQS